MASSPKQETALLFDLHRLQRPPDIGLNCLESDLMPKYTQALSLNRDIALTGDVNCDLLTKNPRGDALRSFCISVNAKQLIEKPTRVTKNSCSLLDLILVFNPDSVQSGDVLNLTISDHYLVFAVLNLRAPKQATNYITARSFRKYNADQFANDIAHIPWDTIDLINSVDEKLDAFNDLFLTCLNAHAPVKTVKLKRKPNPFITDYIKDLIKTRDSMRRTGSVNDWQVFRNLKKEVKSILRKAEKEYFNEQICANKNNTGAIWKTIRRALPKKSSCTTHYTKDSSILGNEFNQFFISFGVNAAAKSAELARSLGLTDYLPSCSNNSPKSGEGLFDFKPLSCCEVREVCRPTKPPLHTSDFN